MSDKYSYEDIRKILSRTFQQNTFDNIICFSNIGLRRVSIITLLQILEEVIEEQKPKTLKINFFDMLPNGDVDLDKIVETLKECPNIKDVLTGIVIPGVIKLTTLEPLCKSGILKNLESITAYGCSLSGKDVLTPELCAMIPSLRELSISQIDNSNICILTADTMCALPPECKIIIYGKDVQVESFSSENCVMELKTLPPTPLMWVNNDYIRVPKTVAEICADAGIHDSITKSALKRC